MRPVTPDDASAVHGLLEAAEAVDRTEEHYAVEDVVEELSNEMIDLARDWVVVERGDEVVAHCRLLPRAVADGELRLSVDGVVHPAHRGQGIASHVVPLMIERAHAFVAERGADLRAVITAQALSSNQGAEEVFAANGLLPHRWSFVMTADLSSPAQAAPPLPDDYALATWADIDPDDLRLVHNVAFVGHPGFSPWSEEMWRQWVSGSRNFRPALSLLARDAHGEVAAYVQTSEFDAMEAATGVRDAFVAKVGTLPGHRRRGLAGALLRIALARYREAGFDTSTLDVDSENPTGALGIYQRAGFLATQRWTSYLLR